MELDAEKCLMQRLLTTLVIAMFGLAFWPRMAYSLHNQEMKALNKKHNRENKALKEQQRAMRNVMNQHELTSDSIERFQHNMKMQRHLSKKQQHEETRRLKQQGRKTGNKAVDIQPRRQESSQVTFP